MARIRTIKPEFFHDEKVGRLSPRARLLFVGTWVIADDYGTFRASSSYLRAQIFPFDELGVSQVADLLDEVNRLGLVRTFEVRGERYGVVAGWIKHQKVDKASRMRVLEACDIRSAADEDSRKAREPSRDTRETVATDRDLVPVPVPGSVPSLAPSETDVGGARSSSHSEEKDKTTHRKTHTSLPEAEGLALWFREQYLSRVDPKYTYSPTVSSSEIQASTALLRKYPRAKIEAVALRVLADDHPPQGPRGWRGWARNCRSISKLGERWAEFEQRARSAPVGAEAEAVARSIEEEIETEKQRIRAERPLVVKPGQDQDVAQGEWIRATARKARELVEARRKEAGVNV